MTAFLLKIIGTICMVVDHLGAVFPTTTPHFFRWIGRIAFPIYAFLTAQSCKQTRDINKYLLRLGIFALVSEIPFDIAFMRYTEDGLLNLNIDFLRHTNVFYTLFLGVACVVVFEKLKNKKKQLPALLPLFFLPAILLVNIIPKSFPVPSLTIASIAMCIITASTLCFAYFLPDNENKRDVPFKKKIIPIIATLPLLMTAAALKTDYGVFGVGLIFLLYLVKSENKIARTITLSASLICQYGLTLISSSDLDNVMSLIFALLSVVLVCLYNGKQGPKFKWAFYIIYPVHISILAVMWFCFAK